MPAHGEPGQPRERGEAPDSPVRDDEERESIAFGTNAEPIPDIVIRRLPIYIRTLRRLAEQRTPSISSEELADHIGVTAAQIRRDLTYFGKFGKQGKGYDIALLVAAIAHILRLDQSWEVALAGFGNLGRAVAQYGGFAPSFRITVIFDQNPETIGQQVDGVAILPATEIAEVVARQSIRIGIIAVPVESAQGVADEMIAGGVRALLNYAPIVLRVPPDVIVREIDPVGAMQSMTYYLDDAGGGRRAEDEGSG